MKTITKTIYVAADGEEFQDIESCCQHEYKIGISLIPSFELAPPDSSPDENYCWFYVKNEVMRQILMDHIFKLLYSANDINNINLLNDFVLPCWVRVRRDGRDNVISVCTYSDVLHTTASYLAKLEQIKP